ncbi:GNAT family N-acetyltransferase [Undibacterium sp. CY18W]|uniref:GNAT family N-acetyltransferase n=1 Tax=Undibacterium hunanense TaxID=2762292 RepID=A0ABR6ZP09_9BURK|nr:GNAT family N-acetyltransferase [Undibacterium hunanense]MBC3917598.1 GNAT family N-acetyltransferase [Undibacterium hunanense]
MSGHVAFTVRKAVAADAPALTVLILQVWLDTYAVHGIRPAIAGYVLDELTLARTSAYLAQAHTHILLAEADQHLVGYCQTTSGKPGPQSTIPDAEQAEVDHLYVHPRFFGHGIGQRLLADAELALQAQGIKQAWLSVWVGNARALQFYPRAAYQETAVSIFQMGEEKIENRIFSKML